jgi:hypothetical protein
MDHFEHMHRHATSTDITRPASVSGANTKNFEKRLAAYAAAGIAGASLLAAVPEAQAKVIYTPTHVIMNPGSTYDLDVNHDGTPEFVFSNWESSFGFLQNFGLKPNSHLSGIVNEGVCVDADGLALAAPAALASGVEIGRQRKFLPYGACMRSDFYSDVQGHWQHVTNRYLGLAMLINQEIHYGWARISTSGNQHFQAVITGYAYESEAYKSIVTGDRGQGAQAPEPVDPASEIEAGPTLGELALGAARR